MSLSQTSKQYWIKKIREQLQNLVDLFLIENNIDKKAAATARSVIIAKNLGTDVMIKTYTKNKKKIETLKKQNSELLKEFLEETKDMYGKSVSDGLGKTQCISQPYSPSYEFFLPFAKIEIRQELLQKYPELIALRRQMEQIPMKIELTTSPVKLQVYLASLLPTIGINLD